MGGGRGLSFQIFRKKRGSQNFPIKMEGWVGKIGGVVLKKGGITYFHTNPFQSYLSLSVWCVCVCLFTPFRIIFEKKKHCEK